MNEEPTYHYIKGQGWVANGIPSIECVMQCGTKIRIEARKPEIGERFGYTVNRRPRHDNDWILEDGTANLERFKESMEHDCFEWRPILE